MNVKEQGERCSCGGEIDCLYIIEPDIWQGRCFICGEKYVIINNPAMDIELHKAVKYE